MSAAGSPAESCSTAASTTARRYAILGPVSPAPCRRRSHAIAGNTPNSAYAATAIIAGPFLVVKFVGNCWIAGIITARIYVTLGPAGPVHCSLASSAHAPAARLSSQTSAHSASRVSSLFPHVGKCVGSACPSAATRARSFATQAPARHAASLLRCPAAAAQQGRPSPARRHSAPMVSSATTSAQQSFRARDTAVVCAAASP